MSILQALDGYYDRMAQRGEVSPPGFSPGKISFAIVLSPDGTPLRVNDLRIQSGKKLVAQQLSVPAEVKRTAGISPNLLWDKTAYVLGRTAGTGKRTAEEQAAFKEKHLALLAAETDAGLVALRKFLESWTPEQFDADPETFQPDMLDANVVFALDGEIGYLHDRPAARALVAAQAGGGGWETFCLVTGKRAPVARLHPSIKGVDGAQSSGASLVSFNLEAFTSYGKTQGDNAPVSEAAAFRYGAALNRLLDRDHGNRIKIGDTVVVYWADASDAVKEAEAEAAENIFAWMLEPPDDAGEAAKVRDVLEAIKSGRPVRDLKPQTLATRFHVLGLAPNAARLSVRFWLSDTFGVFAKRLADHYDDLKIEPQPWGKPPALKWLLVRTTALQGKFENIPNQLAGETARAVLSGSRYPQNLLTAVIARLRAGDNPGTGWHAAVLKAVLNRHFRIKWKKDKTVADEPEKLDPAVEEEKRTLVPPSKLDEDCPSKAYQLGRLFALLEAAQYAALGKVNASIGERYYGAASATPALVFGPLLRSLKFHLADARKRNKGGWIEPRIASVIARLPADLPRTLRLEDQGRFAIGYYHEKAKAFAKPIDTTETVDTTEEGENK